MLPVLALLPAWAAPLLKISLSVPGPHNLSFLPADLMRKVGADRIEGAELRIISVGGGSGALRNLNTRNSDFAMLGMPAIMSQKAKGLDVVAIAAVNDAPLWTLMVRSDLKDEVRNIADLKGRTIGVTTSSATSKTVTQQVMEALLAQAGIEPGEVRFLSIGKNWQDQSACILSGSVDAIMDDEPFATRLAAEGKVFILANPAIPELSPSIPGLGFLHATLVTRSDVINNQPEMAATMVRILRRTLEWLASHSPQEVVAQLYRGGTAHPRHAGYVTKGGSRRQR